jgi:hypothetical protein
MNINTIQLQSYANSKKTACNSLQFTLNKLLAAWFKNIKIQIQTLPKLLLRGLVLLCPNTVQVALLVVEDLRCPSMQKGT